MTNLQPGEQPPARVAIVTGAANGIGRAIAEDLFGAGMRIVVADVDAEGAHRTASELPDAWALPTDVASLEECERLVSATMEREGRLDVLVNNAGLQHVAPIEQFPVDRFEYMLRVMLLGPAMLIRAALPHMYAADWGRIVNIGSINGVVAQPNKSAYVSAKHGLVGLTRSVALEAASHHVTVNCVAPAFVRTQLVEDQLAGWARAEGLPVEEVESRIMLEPSAIKRLIEPAEVAAYVRFLCSDGAAAITGSVQLIDGGWTAR